MVTLIKSLIQKFRVYGPVTFSKYVLWELAYHYPRRVLLKTYSQTGEDLLIYKQLKFKKNGFYVDVGASDPARFSNTQKFYKLGWRGISIEPNPTDYKKLVLARPEDTNLNIGISDSFGELDYFEMSSRMLSSFSSEAMAQSVKEGHFLVSQIKVPVHPLSEVLDTYSLGRKIDFISVDTEGYELTVLKSNNWEKYRPTLICVESSNCDSFLEGIGYKKIGSNKHNTIFTDSNLLLG